MASDQQNHAAQQPATRFSDLELSKRLERAEGNACIKYAEARRRLFPNSGAEWIECAGAYAIFDGIGSPATQSFGLGIFEEPTQSALGSIERFFLDRSAPVVHKVSPFAGARVLDLLCARGYRPIELSNVLYRPVEGTKAEYQAEIRVRSIGPEETQVWMDITGRGLALEHPELRDFLLQHGIISIAREQSVCFLAELGGQSGAASTLCMHEGVALFGGTTTIPEMRRRGLQTALLHERMRYAFEQGCDTAMMVTQPGSGAQRNAERQGFRIAYTRMKWQLDFPRSRPKHTQ